jgi:hypothetical protein
MRREYPEILNCEREPHQVQFLPDSYLYGELAAKVNFNFKIYSLNIILPSINIITYFHCKKKSFFFVVIIICIKVRGIKLLTFFIFCIESFEVKY